MVRIMGTLGLRFGEAAALRRRSVDLLGERLVVEESLAEVGKDLLFGSTKTHAVRRVPLTPTLASAVREHLDTRVSARLDALLFTAREGGQIRHSNFYHRAWQPALKRAGIRRGCPRPSSFCSSRTHPLGGVGEGGPDHPGSSIGRVHAHCVRPRLRCGPRRGSSSTGAGLLASATYHVVEHGACGALHGSRVPATDRSRCPGPYSHSDGSWGGPKRFRRHQGRPHATATYPASAGRPE